MTEFFNTGIASGVGGAIGAAMGSILPGPGTIAGGAAGAVVGEAGDAQVWDRGRLQPRHSQGLVSGGQQTVALPPVHHSGHSETLTHRHGR